MMTDPEMVAAGGLLNYYATKGPSSGGDALAVRVATELSWRNAVRKGEVLYEHGPGCGRGDWRRFEEMPGIYCGRCAVDASSGTMTRGERMAFVSRAGSVARGQCPTCLGTLMPTTCQTCGGTGWVQIRS